MQLHIWAEMLNSGMHLSTTDPPNTSMFNRAGATATAPSRKDRPVPVTQVLADEATISSATAPGASSKPSSPARVIDEWS